MKTVRHFFRAIDIFGVTISFRYGEKEKYKTAFGGFILFLFIILVCILGIYYFIPFVKRKNYTIVYYTMNLATTEEINLFMKESNIAIGLICEKNDNENIDVNSILDLKSNYVIFTKNLDGSYNKDIKQLLTHSCSYNDFYNKYDKQVDYLGLQHYECIDNKNYTIQGIYADQVFSYLEFSVMAKNKSEELSFEIERFLFNNDCKMELVHTDITIDLDNYSYPIDQFLDVTFIQLNPTLFIKRNAYFINQYFTDDNYILFVFGDDEKPKIKTIYSRYEEYSLWKGFNRSINKPKEYDYYSKIYVRADLKKNVLKRKYQKLMEFYADASSLLIALYGILEMIFEFIDTFYAYHSLSKKIFFFKDLEEPNHFNIFKKNKQIKEIISNMNANEKQFNILPNNQNIKKINKHIKESKNANILEIDKKQSDIKIYNINKRIIGKGKMINNNNKINSPKTKNDNNYRYYNQKKYVKEIHQRFDNFNFNNRNKNSKESSNFKSCEKDYLESIVSSGEKFEDLPNLVKQNNKKVKNSFNLFEIIVSQFLKFLMCKNLTIKNNINEKANSILFKKMDVITYVRNMLLFDIVNKSIIDNKNKSIFNFLCRPIISMDNSYNNELNVFYERYKEKDFDNFYGDMNELILKSQKNSTESKLISFSREHLNGCT